ncbi:unnamed protein product [Rhizophagus irregularis]|uniref:Uncharacterized protein n=1 Tax=Rhizophagus irregularis TaxID=588596 RepID=A0A2I1G5H4_9GLOM|nr:hypothetical protein RhiirA4_539917 [Rhizophagus irregularis]CAB4402338.1 unnamed protein product [Rhizophagus irregularis]
MADNTDPITAMTAGSRSAVLIDEDIACAVPELTSGNYSCVNQDVAHATLKEKFGKYHEYYETVKDKVVNFMRGSINKQSTAEDESKEAINITSLKKSP